MSDVVRDVQSHPGYYLPEGAQYRLLQLRDHMRFLAPTHAGRRAGAAAGHLHGRVGVLSLATG